jgi:antitoxin CcdA
MRMKTAYDKGAPKRPVNLSLNEDLVAKARTMTENLSAEVESLLADFLERQTHLRQVEAEKLRRAAERWDDFAERHGSLGDEFSNL